MRLVYRVSTALLFALASSALLAATPAENAQPPVGKSGIPLEAVAAQPDVAPPPKVKGAGKPRGLKPTPKAKLFAAKPFVPTPGVPIPESVAYVPKKIGMWLNNQYGVCVTSEEAFNQDVLGVYITDATVYAFARKHGYLNGATLPEVMETMEREGFKQDGQTYGIGPYYSVNFGNEEILQAALAIAPVKIGIDADALPDGAGDRQGWYALGGRPGQYDREDHCVGLDGYGTAKALYGALGVPVPAGLDPNKKGYTLFTWSTLGFVDHEWIMSTCAEAYVRIPTGTVNGKPVPNPGPPPTPVPPMPTPNPTPTPVPPTPVPSVPGTISVDPVAKSITIVPPAGWTVNGGAMPTPTPPGATSPAVEFVKNHAAKKQARKDGAGLLVSKSELAAARVKIDAAVSDADVETLLKEKGAKIGGPLTDLLDWITSHTAELEKLIELILKLVSLFGI